MMEFFTSALGTEVMSKVWVSMFRLEYSDSDIRVRTALYSPCIFTRILMDMQVITMTATISAAMTHNSPFSSRVKSENAGKCAFIFSMVPILPI